MGVSVYLVDWWVYSHIHSTDTEIQIQPGGFVLIQSMVSLVLWGNVRTLFLRCVVLIRMVRYTDSSLDFDSLSGLIMFSALLSTASNSEVSLKSGCYAGLCTFTVQFTRQWSKGSWQNFVVGGHSEAAGTVFDRGADADCTASFESRFGRLVWTIYLKILSLGSIWIVMKVYSTVILDQSILFRWF